MKNEELFSKINKPMTTVILFNYRSPTATITAINADKCCASLVATCSIPKDAYEYLSNSTEVLMIGESVFARGVNSEFHLVQLESGQRYWVHESLIIPAASSK